jgi:hypothetical protein
MAGYDFPDQVTTTNEKDVKLSCEERDFLSFLLYEFGADYPETEDGQRWYQSLLGKLEN